jgi:hypothetical protein
MPINHRHLLGSTGGPFPQPFSTATTQYQFGNFLIVIIATNTITFPRIRPFVAGDQRPANPIRNLA